MIGIAKSAFASPSKTVQLNLLGGAYEEITINDTEKMTLDKDGTALYIAQIGQTYKLTGSISGETFERTVSEGDTELKCMPEGSLYWYGNECDWITGGWGIDGYSTPAQTLKIGTKETNKLSLKSERETWSAFGTNNAIESKNKTVKITHKNGTSNDEKFQVFIREGKNITDAEGEIIDRTTNILNTLEYIPTIDDIHVFFATTGTQGRIAYVYAVWLE